MRKFVGPQQQIKLYESRTVKRFLWFPKLLPIGSENGPLEWRWLEWAGIHQDVGKNLWRELGWFDRYWEADQEGQEMFLIPILILATFIYIWILFDDDLWKPGR